MDFLQQVSSSTSAGIVSLSKRTCREGFREPRRNGKAYLSLSLSTVLTIVRWPQFRKISTFGRKPSDEGRQSRFLRPETDTLRTSPSSGASQDADGRLPLPFDPNVPTTRDVALVRKSSDADSGAFGLNVVYTPDHGHKADIVFVHGLGGTSRWTWSKNRDPDLFWPLTFLALEPDLCLARILTFGYNATLKKGGHAGHSVLDFAKDLLFDLKYATDDRKGDLQMGIVSSCLKYLNVNLLLIFESGTFDFRSAQYGRAHHQRSIHARAA